jgi:hypothetical protein
MESDFETYYDFGIVTAQSFESKNCSGDSFKDEPVPLELFPNLGVAFSNYLRSLEQSHKDNSIQNSENIIIFKIETPKSRDFESRKKLSIQRFLEKRIQRFNRNPKKIRYESRRKEASKKPRVGGRFVKKNGINFCKL